MSDSNLDSGGANNHVMDYLLSEYKRKYNNEEGAAGARYPRLTEEDEKQYKMLPYQLFQHLMLDRKPLLQYQGPVVFANQMLIKHDVGGKRVPGSCFFCEEVFVNMLEHLKSIHEPEIVELFVDEKEKIGNMNIAQFRSHLVHRAWFRDRNYVSWWEGNGVLMPQRRLGVVKDPTNMIFCCFCLVLINKANWDNHCGTCIPIRSLQSQPTLRGNRLFLWHTLDETAQKEVIISFVVKVIQELEGETKRVARDDMVVGHMLMVEFATHPYSIRSSVKLCKLVCEYFAPLVIDTGVDLPVELLQFRHKELLTKRLCFYRDKHYSWATLVRCLKTLVEQNRYFMYVQLQKEVVSQEAFYQASKLEEFVNSSAEWQLPNKYDEDDIWLDSDGNDFTDEAPKPEESSEILVSFASGAPPK